MARQKWALAHRSSVSISVVAVWQKRQRQSLMIGTENKSCVSFALAVIRHVTLLTLGYLLLWRFNVLLQVVPSVMGDCGVYNVFLPFVLIKYFFIPVTVFTRKRTFWNIFYNDLNQTNVLKNINVIIFRKCYWKCGYYLFIVSKRNLWYCRNITKPITPISFPLRFWKHFPL